MCAVHLLPGQHNCPLTSQPDDATPNQSFRREAQALRARINVAALCQAASALHGGTPCGFFTGNFGRRKATMSGINFDAWVRFADNDAWVVRIPRITTFSHLPADLIESFIQNEYATLKWLSKTGVPVVQAHGYGLASDPSNLVGISYMFMGAMPGKPFNVIRATREQKLRVYGQYAKILAVIHCQKPRKFASSLGHPETDEENQNIHYAIASDGFTHLGRHGPYRTPLQYFVSTAERYLELIGDGQLYPEYAKEAFAFYSLLRDKVAPVLAARSGEDREFWLKHMDDKGDHIRVDKNYNIKAIVNWQLARFVPAEEAFGPSLFTASIGQLYGGTPGLGINDHIMTSMIRDTGNQDLVKFSSSDELARRFQLGLADGLSRTEVLGLIGAVLELLYGDDYRDVEAWCKAQWHTMTRDPRKKKIEKLLAAMAAGGA
ncbi:unnamed protein product [Clonostachys rhizophaga]|uniref:Aminoglycoside phosphotransferase domain-containing protein n=1 Tax=Clonostachys rhizophaga TaxID=160324 RepID=A0A9N9VUA2_9HYPO|nr:unnamed protein product [Clonostachys rhizophaga]